jgi:asparagine synthase (glutamine-hydrolysing)
MSCADGRYWITCNGELYNFRQLRKELERDGFGFATETDTEVLLAMYARHGADMLGRLNGIFALAIWDTRVQALFLARDRLGVKPLYYSSGDGVLAFASEVKALLPVIGRPRMNTAALSEYLTFLWVPDPNTLFEGVMKLPPGHFATYGREGLTIRQWWDMRFAPEDGDEDWAAATREAVQSAVRRQMVSDVPLGSFLSGGLDSSAIVAEMAAAGRCGIGTEVMDDQSAHRSVAWGDVRRRALERRGPRAPCHVVCGVGARRISMPGKLRTAATINAAA